jgi:hypothetical protein
MDVGTNRYPACACNFRLSELAFCSLHMRLLSTFLDTDKSSATAAGKRWRSAVARFELSATLKRKTRRLFAAALLLGGLGIQGKRITAFSIGISLWRLSLFAFGGGFQFPGSPDGTTPCTSNDSKTYGTPSEANGERPFITWKCK